MYQTAWHTFGTWGVRVLLSSHCTRAETEARKRWAGVAAQGLSGSGARSSLFPREPRGCPPPHAHQPWQTPCFFYVGKLCFQHHDSDYESQPPALQPAGTGLPAFEFGLLPLLAGKLWPSFMHLSELHFCDLNTARRPTYRFTCSMSWHRPSAQHTGGTPAPISAQH